MEFVLQIKMSGAQTGGEVVADILDYVAEDVRGIHKFTLNCPTDILALLDGQKVGTWDVVDAAPNTIAERALRVLAEAIDRLKIDVMSTFDLTDEKAAVVLAALQNTQPKQD